MPATVEQIELLVTRYTLPIIYSAIAIIVAYIVFKLLQRGLNRAARTGFLHQDLLSFMLGVVRWLVLIVLLLVILGIFGISVVTFWAALSGALALVALGFVAVWSVLSNAMCSVLLVIFAPFRIGDDIEVQDPAAPVSIRGKVESISLMFTTLNVGLDESNTAHLIRVPNNIFFQKYVRLWQNTGSESIQHYIARHHKTDNKQN